MRLGTWGSYGIETLKILPGEGWEGLTITATFVTPTTSTRMLVSEDGIVTVPPEATASVFTAGFPARIVFSGVADGVQRITTDLPYRVSDHAPIEGDDPTPTPSEWEQLVNEFQNRLNRAVPPDSTPGYLLGATEDGNAWVPQTGGGGTGADGGYYTPAIEQTEPGTADFSWTASKASMPTVPGVRLTLPPGQDGEDGVTPTIGENGNWYLGEIDTGKPSRGEPGKNGDDGDPGAAAGFGTITATATQLASGQQPTFNAEWSGPNEAKNLTLSIGVPAGPQGPAYELTPEDKSSIVQDVLAALPNAEGVGF